MMAQPKQNSISPFTSKQIASNTAELDRLTSSPLAPNDLQTTPLKTRQAIDGASYADTHQTQANHQQLLVNLPDTLKPIENDLLAITRGQKELLPDFNLFRTSELDVVPLERTYQLPETFKYNKIAGIAARGDQVFCHNSEDHEFLIVDVSECTKLPHKQETDPNRTVKIKMGPILGYFFKVIEIPETQLLLLCSAERVDVCDVKQARITSSLGYKEFKRFGTATLPGANNTQTDVNANYRDRLGPLGFTAVSGLIRFDRPSRTTGFYPEGDYPTFFVIIHDLCWK